MDGSTKNLSDGEIYRRDGFVVPDFRFPPDVVARMQTRTMELVEQYPFINTEPFPSPHVHYNHRKGLRSPHTDDWMKIAADQGLLDVVEGVMGPDIILWGSSLFYKKAQGGPATSFHRDGPFWPIKPIANTTAWISWFDSKVDNGCLRCIPGSHLSKEWGRHYESKRTDIIAPITLAEDEYDESKAVDVELKPGQVVLFDVRTIHGSNHNTGARPRAGFALRLMPGTSHYDHDDTKKRRESGEVYERRYRDLDYAARPLFLLRGRDCTGLNDFTRNHIPQGA